MRGLSTPAELCRLGWVDGITGQQQLYKVSVGEHGEQGLTRPQSQDSLQVSTSAGLDGSDSVSKGLCRTCNDDRLIQCILENITVSQHA